MATVKPKKKVSPDTQKKLLAELDDPILNRIAANIRKSRRLMRESEPLFEKLRQIVEEEA